MAAERAFRPDLEGLRGAAILLVVLFHAGVPGFGGAFVAVDVFFVLSGFFITALLARELAASGSVDLPAFYGRRAVRLLPVLLVVVLATLAMVMSLYAPVDRAAIAAAARPVALYSGNLEFARGSLDYFGSGDNPLLHTWSLGVEEQFYLAWPLLFLVVAGLFARKAGEGIAANGGEATRRRMLVAVGVAGLASFIVSVWLTHSSQPWAFFGMASRVWEFAAGGALALVVARLGEPDAGASPVPNDGATASGTLLQLTGLLVVVIALAMYDRSTPYPGLAATLPVAGALALIVGGLRAPSSAVSRGLATRPLRWLGHLSYAWYLWHWPLIALGATLHPDIGPAGKLGWAAAALALAWSTHRFIERPARETWAPRLRSTWVLPAALGASAAVAGVSHGAMRAAERRASQEDQRIFAAAREDRVADECWATTVETTAKPCEFGDRSSATTLVLLGDSHAQHWLAALDRAGRESGWKVVAMVKGGCPVADMPGQTHPRMKRFYRECTRYREAMLRRIVAMRPSAVILSSWDHYVAADGGASPWQVTPAMWRDGLRRTYARLHGAGIRTIAIRGTPRTWFDVPTCLSRRAAGLPFSRSCTYDRGRAFVPAAIAAQNEAARGLDVRFVDMNDQICATSRCGVLQGKRVIFTDDNHLTASFSRSLFASLGSRLGAELD